MEPTSNSQVHMFVHPLYIITYFDFWVSVSWASPFTYSSRPAIVLSIIFFLVQTKPKEKKNVHSKKVAYDVIGFGHWSNSEC